MIEGELVTEKQFNLAEKRFKKKAYELLSDIYEDDKITAAMVEKRQLELMTDWGKKIFAKEHKKTGRTNKP